MFGYKSPIGINWEHGFLGHCTLTHAAAFDGDQLGAVLGRNNTATEMWSDHHLSSAANLDSFLIYTNPAGVADE